MQLDRTLKLEKHIFIFSRAQIQHFAVEAKLKVSCYVVSGGWIKRKSSRNNKVEKNQRIKEAQRAKMKSEGQISTYTLTHLCKGKKGIS